jgi:peptidoglycan/xylan/chitin deacetylase (PgdA/CDA1 family)
VDLVAFSLRTKGAHNFARRLWTVFARFGFSDARTREALRAVVHRLKAYDAAPTFFIPAVVLDRHPALLQEIQHEGAEIGIHGYVHNDYRTLALADQHQQTKRAIGVFDRVRITHAGFRNPYLGWTEDSVRVFGALGFTYDSNEAVHHAVVNVNALPERLRGGYQKSLALFQAIPCTPATLRPRLEDGLVRIPTSIPDDEMLFDRLRITSAEEVGRLWSEIMRRIYDLGGIYVLNLHPERAVPCGQALDLLLASARQQALPVWIARCDGVAQWWSERSAFGWHINRIGPEYWQVSARCSSQATVLARGLEVVDATATAWWNEEQRVAARRFAVRSPKCPCIAVSPETSVEVVGFLREQGYAYVICSGADAVDCALRVDMPEGLGHTPEARHRRRSELVRDIEQADTPLVRFGLWPDGHRAALSITGDIDSVTIQDFFLRIVEVR